MAQTLTTSELTVPRPRQSASQLIRADDVRKSYRAGRNDVEILHGISLEVTAGEAVAVMGPSGSGKSTLLYCLAGLEPATSGDIVLDGVPLAQTSRTRLAEMRRDRVGFVFQSYNLLPTLTAAENVALPYLLAGRKPPSGAVANALATVGLEAQAQARPPSMSGGEQQRVAVARVLAQQPRVLFADEPTGALDTRTGGLVLDALAGIAADPGRCVLIVTHDPQVAARCDRVVFCRDGLLVEQVAGWDAALVAETLARLSERAG